MPLQVPLEPVYVYEATPGWRTIYLWLPPSELKRQVEAGALEASVLGDYPGGLEAEMERSKLEDYAQLYGLRVQHTPEQLHRALAALQRGERRLPQFGYLRRDLLEELAEAMEHALREVPPAGRALPEMPRRRMDVARYREGRRMRAALADPKVARLLARDADRPLPERAWARVRMSDGERPAAAFARMTARRRR